MLSAPTVKWPAIRSAFIAPKRIVLTVSLTAKTSSSSCFPIASGKISFAIARKAAIEQCGIVVRPNPDGRIAKLHAAKLSSVFCCRITACASIWDNHGVRDQSGGRRSAGEDVRVHRAIVGISYKAAAFLGKFFAVI